MITGCSCTAAPTDRRIQRSTFGAVGVERADTATAGVDKLEAPHSFCHSSVVTGSINPVSGDVSQLSGVNRNSPPDPNQTYCLAEDCSFNTPFSVLVLNDINKHCAVAETDTATLRCLSLVRHP